MPLFRRVFLCVQPVSIVLRLVLPVCWPSESTPRASKCNQRKKRKREKRAKRKLIKAFEWFLCSGRPFLFSFFKKSLFHSFNYLTFSIKASRVANRIYLRRSPISKVRTDSLIVVHRDPRAAWPSRSTFPGKPIKVLIHRDRFFRRSIGALVLLILAQWRD